MVMNLACVDLRMSINEALAAATINSAFALGVESQKGSLEVGKDADLVIIESDRYKYNLNFNYSKNYKFQLFLLTIYSLNLFHKMGKYRLSNGRP